MAYDLEEQEKIDQIKSWWASYGNIVTTLLTLIAVAYLAFQGYQWYENRQAKKSLIYYDIVYSVSQNFNPQSSDIKRLEEAIKVLKDDFSSSAYTDRAILIASDIYFKNKDLASSALNLNWVLDNSDDVGIKETAKLNLSSVLLVQGEIQKAKDLLKNPSDDFKALFDDRLADIYMSEGKKEEAFKIWKSLLQIKTLDENFLEVINMKLKVYGAE